VQSEPGKGTTVTVTLPPERVIPDLGSGEMDAETEEEAEAKMAI
jgi:hypothetical protein